MKIILACILIPTVTVVASQFLVAYSQNPPAADFAGLGVYQCLEFPNSTFTVCIMSNLPKTLTNVLAIDEDAEIHAQQCQHTPPWHLQRITQRNKLTDTWHPPYRYLKQKQTVGVYVLDTFVDCSHQQFQGRCKRVFSNQYTVSNPHGTHVAGIVGSMEFGVNKYAQIFSVEVLNDNGTGTWSKLVEALSFVARDALNRKLPAVINLSISGPPSYVVDMAIQQLSNQGILTIVAAGNSNDNACYHSPARAQSAIAVGATNRQDQLAAFSNWGICVDILAPGDVVQSLLPNQQTGYMSGTSMAAPVVAGIASVVLAMQPELDVESLRKLVMDVASKNVVADPKQSKNRLAYQPYGAPCELEMIFRLE